MTPSAPTSRHWGAIWVALAAGVLSVVVASGLAWNHRQLERVNPTNHPAMAHLTAELEKVLDKPAQREPLREQIRVLDQQLRQEYFGRLRFERTGLAMLMIALAVLAVSAGKALFQAAPPMPKPTTEPPSPTPAATARRWSLAATVAVLAAFGAFLGAISPRHAATSIPSEASAGPATAAAQPAPGREQLAANWPSFRGADSGLATQAKPVLTWDAPAGKNVLWKTAIPLPGHGSPVVWGERVFVSGANEKSQALYCLDATSGAILWQRPVQTAASTRAGTPKVMEDTGFAAPTPVTDGRFVAAIFPSGDLACFGIDGKPAWTVALGPIDSRYGYAASLAFSGNLVLVQLDQADVEAASSRLIAFAFATGKKVWETPRPVGASWASPVVIAPPGLPVQVVTCANPWVISYDAATGKELWKANVLSGDVAPSPVYAGGLVYVVNTEPKLSAIKPDGQGDVTATHVVWTAEDGLPDIVSPLTDGAYLLLAQSSGTLTCYDAKSGKKVWDKQFDEDGFRGSPTLVAGKLVVVTGGGVGIVADWSGEGYHEIARNPLGEEVTASPAFVGAKMFIRGKDHLFCIGEKP